MSIPAERALVVTADDHLPPPVTGNSEYPLVGSQVGRQWCRRADVERRRWAACHRCRLSPSVGRTGSSSRRWVRLPSTRARTTWTRTSRRAGRSKRPGSGDEGRRDGDLRSSRPERARREPAPTRQHRRLPPDGAEAGRPLHRRALRLPVLWRERPEPPFSQVSLESLVLEAEGSGGLALDARAADLERDFDVSASRPRVRTGLVRPLHEVDGILAAEVRGVEVELGGQAEPT